MKRMIRFLWLLLLPAVIFGQEYQVGDHELLFMPTAYTMPQGSAYFTDYELFFINFSYAPTSTTHIGFFSLFPITTNFLESATLGLKQNIVRSTNLANAAWVTYTPKGSGLTIGDVFSIGKPSNGLHLGLAEVTEFNSSVSKWFTVYLAGYRYDMSKKLSLLLEYMNAQVFIDAGDFKGLLSIGLRFHAESVCWEIGGFRPLANTENLFLIPIVKGTFMF